MTVKIQNVMTSVVEAVYKQNTNTWTDWERTVNRTGSDRIRGDACDLTTSQRDVKPRHEIWQLRLHSPH